MKKHIRTALAALVIAFAIAFSASQFSGFIGSDTAGGIKWQPMAGSGSVKPIAGSGTVKPIAGIIKTKPAMARSVIKLAPAMAGSGSKPPGG